MTDPNKEAAGILRGILDRVENLEENVSTATGTVNLLRSFSDKVSISDTVSTSISGAGTFTWDQDNWDQQKWQ